MALIGLALLTGAGPAAGQSVLERSPNVHGVWTLPGGTAAFVFAHRFEFQNGGDELFNIPTLTLALGLPYGLTAGLDFSSYSEVVPGHLAGNETQYWVKRSLLAGSSSAVAALVGYNSAARSWDGAIDVRQEVGARLALFGELRGFTDRFGRGGAGAAGAVGATFRVTEYLGISGDVGRVMDDDTVPSAWSAALAVAIPGSPHTMSLQATNSGAITLQGASRGKVIGRPGKTRYGFVFTVPLGGGARWLRILRPAAAPPPPPAVGQSADSAVATVQIRMIAFTPGEVRIRRGQTVEWINRDPIAHTVTAESGEWGSELLEEGGRYSRRFDAPGRYSYYCTPHPQMRGVVIVEDG
jgi:plastocyanin